MPEEISNDQPQAPVGPDSPAVENTAPAAEPEPEIRYAYADTIDQPDPGSVPRGEEEPGQVPSFRLREEASRRRQAEENSTMLMQQNQLLQNQLQQSGQAPQDTSDTDEERRPFGSDEEGDTAYRAVRGVSEKVAQETVQGMRNEIRQELQADFDTKLGSVTASIQMSEELAGMKANGLIDDASEKEIGRRMGEVIRQDSRWGQQANQRHLLNEVWTNMLRNGEIKPTTRPATPSGGSMPLQPSGSTQLTEKQLNDNNDAQLLDIQRQHPNKFGGMSLDELRTLGGPMSKETGPAPQQDNQASVPSRTYTHTR